MAQNEVGFNFYFNNFIIIISYIGMFITTFLYSIHHSSDNNSNIDTFTICTILLSCINIIVVLINIVIIGVSQIKDSLSSYDYKNKNDEGIIYCGFCCFALVHIFNFIIIVIFFDKFINDAILFIYLCCFVVEPIIIIFYIVVGFIFLIFLIPRLIRDYINEKKQQTEKDIYEKTHPKKEDITEPYSESYYGCSTDVEMNYQPEPEPTPEIIIDIPNQNYPGDPNYY